MEKNNNTSTHAKVRKQASNNRARAVPRATRPCPVFFVGLAHAHTHRLCPPRTLTLTLTLPRSKARLVHTSNKSTHTHTHTHTHHTHTHAQPTEKNGTVPINQLTNQATKQATNQPSNQATDQPTSQIEQTLTSNSLSPVAHRDICPCNRRNFSSKLSTCNVMLCGFQTRFESCLTLGMYGFGCDIN